jgi:hypothetical protein
MSDAIELTLRADSATQMGSGDETDVGGMSEHSKVNAICDMVFSRFSSLIMFHRKSHVGGTFFFTTSYERAIAPISAGRATEAE